MMHIDSYKFGSIVIDGVKYSSDCLLFSDSVQDKWWREQGHVLSIEDLQSVIAVKPSILVVGCGTPGLMKVPDKTRRFLKEHNIELIALNTHKAIKFFNELSEAQENVAAAFHLTC